MSSINYAGAPISISRSTGPTQTPEPPRNIWLERAKKSLGWISAGFGLLVVLVLAVVYGKQNLPIVLRARAREREAKLRQLETQRAVEEQRAIQAEAEAKAAEHRARAERISQKIVLLEEHRAVIEAEEVENDEELARRADARLRSSGRR